jgi:hypothetical protein
LVCEDLKLGIKKNKDKIEKWDLVVEHWVGHKMR